MKKDLLGPLGLTLYSEVTQSIHTAFRLLGRELAKIMSNFDKCDVSEGSPRYIDICLALSWCSLYISGLIKLYQRLRSVHHVISLRDIDK